MITGKRPIRARPTAPAARIVAFVTAAAVAAAGLPTRVHAQGKLPLIRDTETEQLLRDYTRPILRAAGLAKQNIRIVIINARNFNAFVKSSACWRTRPAILPAGIWRACANSSRVRRHR